MLSVGGACARAGDREAVREWPGQKFIDDPDAVRAWPRRCQFQAGESSRDALDCVLARHLVRPESTNQPAAEPPETVSARLAGNERVRARRNGRQQDLQLRILEVMQEQRRDA